MWQSVDCVQCMKEYAEQFVVSAPVLRVLPTKSDGLIDWSRTDHANMQNSLSIAFEQHRASTEVLFCTGPLWFCLAARRSVSAPFCMLDLVLHDLGAPHGAPLGADTVTWMHDDMDHEVASLASHPHGPTGEEARAIFVRQGLGQSYATMSGLFLGVG